jgi:uncharacterized protein (TIGR03435 family)
MFKRDGGFSPAFRISSVILAGLSLAVFHLQAQSRPEPPPAAKPEFEVASIKRSTATDGGYRNLGANGRLVIVNNTLRQIIMAAYGIEEFQLIGGPAWIGSERFDVEGRSASNTPLSEQYLMLRTLLADPFKLVVHHEQRERPVYHLVKARRDGRLGPRIKPSTAECPAGGRGLPPPPGSPTPASECRSTLLPTGLEFTGQTTAQLATVLGMALRQAVIDQTGLAGRYDMQVTFSFDGAAGPSPDAPPPGPDVLIPVILRGVEEQLGFKVERHDGLVDFVVIDNVDKLIEN